MNKVLHELNLAMERKGETKVWLAVCVVGRIVFFGKSGAGKDVTLLDVGDVGLCDRPWDVRSRS